jgi:hypothetical protein
VAQFLQYIWLWLDCRYGQTLFAQPPVRCPVFKRSGVSMKFWKLFSPLPYFAHAVLMLQTSTRHEAPHYAVCCLFPFRSKYFEHTVLIRERPSFIHLTIYGQNCHGNCVVCSPCQINSSLLRQFCALFIYGLLCDATRLQRHITGQGARLLQTSVCFLNMIALGNIRITSVLHSLWWSSTIRS